MQYPIEILNNLEFLFGLVRWYVCCDPMKDTFVFKDCLISYIFLNEFNVIAFELIGEQLNYTIFWIRLGLNMLLVLKVNKFFMLCCCDTNYICGIYLVIDPIHYLCFFAVLYATTVDCCYCYFSLNRLLKIDLRVWEFCIALVRGLTVN